MQARTATGQFVKLGQSKEVMKSLNPSWEAVEVTDLQALRAVQAVRIEVRHWDQRKPRQAPQPQLQPLALNPNPTSTLILALPLKPYSLTPEPEP